ncbi:MAG: hypothetical protein MJD61_05120 [Proteobacteria bacterium]|nr:hypothetical protein [Pseudomonadota bacterium]
MRGYRQVVLVGLVTALVAGCSCGDDDPVTGDDAAIGDGGMDAMPPDAQSDTGTGTDSGLPAACQNSECSLLDPASCAMGQGCQLRDTMAGAPEPVCEAAGTGKSGDACTTPADCAPGLGCSDADNKCHQYCCDLDTSTGCPPNQACWLELTDRDTHQRTGVGFCDDCDDCDLLAQTGCTGAQGCYSVTEKNDCTACLASAKMVDEGMPCEAANDCRPGLGCYSLDMQPTRCVAYCQLPAMPGGADSCGMNAECQDNLGLAGVGLCVPK